MGGLALVLLILLAVVALQAAILLPMLRTWRRRSKRFVADFRAQADLSGERIVKGPERAVYRGATGTYSKVKGNGTLILTDRRLVFRKLTGGMVDVPLSTVTGARQAKGFNGSRVGGMTHLVVATADPAEIGLFLDDVDAWEGALAAQMS